jgi:hypothetical protein
MNSLRRAHLVKFSLLLFAFWLRVYDLTGEGLWLDEASSANFVQRDFADMLTVSANDPHPPLYYTLLWGWTRALGYSDFALRCLSVMLGALTIAVVFRLGTQAGGWRLGALGALLVTTSPFHIQYSQEVRQYALLAFVAVSATERLGDLSGHWTRTAWLTYGLAAIALPYAHLYGLFILAGHNIWFLWQGLFSKPSPARWRCWVLVQGVVGLLFAPRLPTLLSQTDIVCTYCLEPALGSVLGVLLLYSWSLPALLLCLVLGIFALGLWLSRWVRRLLRRVALISVGAHLSLWLTTLAMTHIAPLLLSSPDRSIYFDRPTIGGLPLYFLGIGASILALPERRLRLGLAAALVATQTSAVWTNYYVLVRRQQWREAVVYVETKAAASETVWIFPAGAEVAFFWYARRTDLHVRPLANLDSAELRASLPQPQRSWLVLLSSAPLPAEQKRLSGEGLQPLSPPERFVGLEVQPLAPADLRLIP